MEKENYRQRDGEMEEAYLMRQQVLVPCTLLERIDHGDAPYNGIHRPGEGGKAEPRARHLNQVATSVGNEAHGNRGELLQGCLG